MRPNVVPSYSLFYRSSPHMGRKRTAKERRMLAKRNGYIDDETAGGVNDDPIPWDVEPCTREKYDAQLASWYE